MSLDAVPCDRRCSETVTEKLVVEQSSLRHSEKARNATCPWADRVAAAALKKFRESSPKEMLESCEQTVVAAFLLYHEKADSLGVVSVASGTKFVAIDIIDRDTEGDSVRDCHAEILSKRGLQEVLHQEVKKIRRGEKSSWAAENSGKLALKDDVSLHFYTSSQPCGNACVKRWGKGDKKHSVDATTSELCAATRHEKIHIMQRAAGQIALSLKGTQPSGQCEDSCEGKRKPGTEMILAPSTSAPGTPGLRTHTCSDKIAVWNVLGVQGTLLSCVWQPLYISTITIGRKFSELHARRAMCCRLQELRTPERCTHYKLNHPWYLCTSLKLDNSIKNQTDRAVFDDPRCMLWYDGTASVEVINGSTGLLMDGSASSVAKSHRREFCSLVEDCGSLAYSEAKLKVLQSCRERSDIREELFSGVFADWCHN